MNGKFAKTEFLYLETFRPKHIYAMFSNKCFHVYFFDKCKVPPCFLKEKQMSQAMRKCVLCHMRTTKAQICLRIRAA